MLYLVADSYPNKESIENLTYAKDLFLHGVVENLAGFDLVHWVGEKPKIAGPVAVQVYVTSLLLLECTAFLRPDGTGYVVLNGDIKASAAAFGKMKVLTAQL